MFDAHNFLYTPSPHRINITTIYVCRKFFSMFSTLNLPAVLTTRSYKLRFRTENLARLLLRSTCVFIMDHVTVKAYVFDRPHAKYDLKINSKLNTLFAKCVGTRKRFSRLRFVNAIKPYTNVIIIIL